MMDEISFTSGRDRCAAWHFSARGDGFASVRGAPCVVMAPGFGGTRHTYGLVAYAQALAAAGLDVVLFDYRGFGESSGLPRQLVSASHQRQDYRAAIAAARRLPGVDPDRIVLWGISYSGGHIVRVAAEDGHVAAVVSLTPAMDGVAVLAQLARNAGPCQLLRAAGHGLRDAQRAVTGRPPHRVPMVGEPGSKAIIAKHARSRPTPRSRPKLRNEVCAHRPRGGIQPANPFAPRINCPLLVQAGTHDSITRRPPLVERPRRPVHAES